MNRRIVLALCVAVEIGLTLMMPEVQAQSANEEHLPCGFCDLTKTQWQECLCT
jgi:hypothetical protein